MKKSILLLSSFLLIHCGSKDQPSAADIIASGDLSAMQRKKAELVKAINNLQGELESLNTAIATTDTAQKFLLVTAINLKTESYQHYVTFQGNLSTDRNLVLYPEISGLLKNITVREGQRVKKGDRMATLSDSGMIEQLQQLILQMELAKTTFERQERLWNQKIGSEIQYLQAKTQYLSLQKSVAQMRDQVDKTTIVAPFDGIVDHIIADPGSNMVPGLSPIIRVVNLDQMKIEAEIPEIHLPNIRPNTPVNITIPVLGNTRAGRIVAVGNFINPNNRSFRIEIALSNPDKSLKPNMTAQLNINDYQNPAAILVPTKNILEDQNGRNYVFRLVKTEGENNTFTAIKTFVKLGKSSENKAEILEGLKAGDRIVADGIRLVEDQQLVKIIQS